MTIKKALELAGRKISPLEADILLSCALKKNKIFLYQNPEYMLSPKLYTLFTKLVFRRQKGEPIAYITKCQEFYGLDFYIDESVLIPRPETEILVEEVMKKIQSANGRRQIVADIGTGSGNISITIATQLKIKSGKLKIYAIDISKDALKVAKINAQKYQVEDKIMFLQGDLLKPLPEKVDIIVANLPYIQNSQKILTFEPPRSLYGGRDGIALIKALLQAAATYLKKSGAIFLEISPEQKIKLTKTVLKILPEAKFEFKRDLAGFYRVLIVAI